MIILARVVSSPTRVIRTVSEPFTLMLPPVTSLPGALSTGRLSPVSMDSSTPPSPSSTSPSSGTRSPGRTSTTSPGRRISVGTSVRLPPSPFSRAVSGVSSMSFLMAPVVLCLLEASMCFPSETSVTTTAADSKYSPSWTSSGRSVRRNIVTRL